MKEKTLKTPSAAIIGGLIPVILKWLGVDVSSIPPALLDSITVILCTVGGMVFGARWKAFEDILDKLD